MGGPRLDPTTRIWYDGAWRSPEAVENKRKLHRERQTERRRTGTAQSYDKRVNLHDADGHCMKDERGNYIRIAPHDPRHPEHKPRQVSQPPE